MPERVRRDASAGGMGSPGERDRKEKGDGARKSFTWIIEVASQVLFSTTAAVHFELLVGRDEKSVSLGFTGVVSSHGAPGRLEDHTMGKVRQGASLPKGVFTKAVRLQVDDTVSLWNFPAFPEKKEEIEKEKEKVKEKVKENGSRGVSEKEKDDKEEEEQRPRKKRKKIHLVILTHGLHSNLGADMLYMKESIDAAAKQAKEDAKKGKEEARKKQAAEQNDFARSAVDQRAFSTPEVAIAPTPSFDDDDEDRRTSQDDEDAELDDDDEQVLVRGFNGNCVRTERGIQYLGKRLAKYVLSLTYPDQPFLPIKSTITQSISRTFTGQPKPTLQDGRSPVHQGSSIVKEENADKYDLPYQITSISFVGHSLGGLVQTYAIAYIQKHSPEFFDKIRPINFVSLASPFLGLSNENPMYVKFALDFGLVGRTGQDLGLTWRAPTIARNGWGAVVGGFSSGDHNKQKEQDPGTKPLLRILPTGPAHVALKRFRNRSVYSNVVNDGIVPLRTSCLLFLDWRGLGRVEKARRENGTVGTLVNWGLNEITGQNASVPRKGFFEDLFSDSGDEIKSSKKSPDPGSKVPQADASSELDRESYDGGDEGSRRNSLAGKVKSPEQTSSSNLWSTLSNFFRPSSGSQAHATPKQQKIYRRGQINVPESQEDVSAAEQQHENQEDDQHNHRKLLVRGSSLYTNNSDNENLEAPPRTTVFESAGDLLNPPLPPKEFLLDPQARPRTIFHDRVYHPEDIPPPPIKRQRTFLRTKAGGNEGEVPNQSHSDTQNISTSRSNSMEGGMRIEEKIARAYHKDMAWRKVLVRLEPDAHNNIIVRRMFANAYGWPVVKHMCDTHFGYTAAARTADEDEEPVERAKDQDAAAGKEGQEVNDQTQAPDENKAQAKATSHRALTTDELPKKNDEEVRALHIRQQNIRAGRERDLESEQETEHKRVSPNISKPNEPKSRSKSPAHHARTLSERRESRDKVSDLVTMISAQGEPSQSYSNMHSGTAALHGLVRRDSSRWSDRFFDSDVDDGEESDDDHNDLNTELQRAYDRGILKEQPVLKDQPLSTSPRQSTHTLVGRQSLGTSSMEPARRVLSDTDRDKEETRVVATPETLSRQASRDNMVDAGYPDTQTRSLTGLGLGLRRNVHQVAAEKVQGSSPDQDHGEGESAGGVITSGEESGGHSFEEMGVVEQVARARSHSIGVEEDEPDEERRDDTKKGKDKAAEEKNWKR